MQKTVGEIAKLIHGEVLGDANIVIKGVCGIKEAKAGDITFLANLKYASLLEKTKASAVIVPKNITVEGKSAICVDNPSIAFSKTVSLFLEQEIKPFRGVHPTVIIGQDTVIGKDVSIGPYTVIESKAILGDRTTIYSHCYVGQQTAIGDDCLIYPNVSIREKIFIGHRVIVHSGTVIGSDGFGFVNVDGIHKKIPQIGIVVIEDDVEIGANVTIDRARFEKTFIGRGTKIDNLVQIAHNVIIGENCIIVSQSGISGSVTIEKGAILAGQAGIAGHLTIGEGAVVASKSGVSSSVPPHTIVFGYPARPHMEAKRINASLTRLPEYIKVINDLKKRVEALESKLKK